MGGASVALAALAGVLRSVSPGLRQEALLQKAGAEQHKRSPLELGRRGAWDAVGDTGTRARSAGQRAGRPCWAVQPRPFSLFS